MTEMFSDRLSPEIGICAKPLPMTLNIARHIKTKGIKQTDLADTLGISRSYMSLLASGQREPSPALLAKLAQALGVSVADLFDDGTGPSRGMAESSVEPITAPANRDLAILELSRESARHPILYTARNSAPALGILAGDTLVIDLHYTLRIGDVVIATETDANGGAQTDLYRWCDDVLVPADPAKIPHRDTTDSPSILGVISATFRGR